MDVGDFIEWDAAIEEAFDKPRRVDASVEDPWEQAAHHLDGLI